MKRIGIEWSRSAGFTYETLVNRILDVAHWRYFNTPALRDEAAIADHHLAARA